MSGTSLDGAPKLLHRPSILLRPKTKASLNNIETADSQYEIEQQRTNTVRRKREELDAERMRLHSSEPGDRALVLCARAESLVPVSVAGRS